MAMKNFRASDMPGKNKDKKTVEEEAPKAEHHREAVKKVVAPKKPAAKVAPTESE